MFIKGMIAGTLLDQALKLSWHGAKAIFTPLFKGFQDQTGQKLGERAFDEVWSLLSPSEIDETIISDALQLLKDNEAQAWHNKMATFEPKRAGFPLGDVGDAAYQKACEEGFKLKEFYRKFTAKQSAQLTAAKMRYDAGMNHELWKAYLASLDIKRKALETKYAPFFAWIETNGHSFLDKAGANIDQVNTNVGGLADSISSWTANFKANRGL